jgi:hypothetical protein
MVVGEVARQGRRAFPWGPHVCVGGYVPPTAPGPRPRPPGARGAHPPRPGEPGGRDHHPRARRAERTDRPGVRGIGAEADRLPSAQLGRSGCSRGSFATW